MTSSGTVSRTNRLAGENQSVSLSSARRKAITVVVVGMEAVLLILVCLSPWAYGAVHPGFEFLLDAGVGLLLLLWGVRMLLEGQLTWKKSPVAVCLAGLFLIGMCQLTPVPRSLLARLSPATAQLYNQLLPDQAETLPEGVDGPAVSPPPGSTLSLYPGATRKEVSRLLAVFLVFAVVRNNLVSTAALMRLSVASLVNGTLLSLFALAQFFSAPPQTVYWSYPALGQVFGPFINRNHFPYYINMCIGLGIGLLVSRSWRDSASPRRSGDAWPPEQSNSFLRILHDPPALWTCAALGLMVSSVALCRSRGGMLALVGAAVLCAVLGRLKLAGSFRLGVALPVGVVAFALSGWFGLGLIKERLDTFWSGEAFDTRIPLWMRSLPIAADFPVLGTGFGTYGYIEPVYRVDVPAKEEMLLYDHAHNDYLEMLVECGVPGLFLALLAIAVVYRLGYRALGQNRGIPAAGLTLGALFAFTTLVLHSFGEFGAHIPAITLLATVVCAHLCAQGRSNLVDHGSWIVDRNNGSRSTIHDSRERDEYRLRLGGLAPLFGAVIALSLGLMLCASGWKEHRINRLQAAAAREGESNEDQLRRRIPLLAVAAAAGRDDANLQCELGRARSLLFELDKFGHPQGGRAESAQATRALQAYLQARDACPVLSNAQLGIAAGATRLAKGDPQEAYLNRVKRLSPSQAERWFSCGRLELDARHEEAAWASWRRSLELSESNLPRILPRSAAHLKPDQLIDKVLPDKAGVLLAAALRLYPDASDTEARRPFLAKALKLLEANTERLEPAEMRVKALAHQALDQPEEAIASYRRLLSREPRQVEWRFEFARYLHTIHKLDESRRELVIVLNQDPHHGLARDLLEIVMRDLLRERSNERPATRGDE